METGIVKFDITETAIVSLAEKYAEPTVPVTKDEYDALKLGIKEVATLRIAIDKERKEQNSAALAHQREVNKVGNGIIERLKAIEEPMKLCKAEVDDMKEREIREAEEAEEARLNGINTRIANIESYGVVSINDSLEDVKARLARVEELDVSTGFDEFAKKAADTRTESLANLKAGIETLTKQAELDRRMKDIEAREAKANAAQAEIDKAEREKKEKEQAAELKRLRELEDEQAERDMKAAAEAEAARQRDLAPDKEKLMVYAQGLREVIPPKLDSTDGEAVMGKVLEWVHTLITDIESEADRL